jgi:2-keto-4-pentenoate hydratase/2-oxohepta-3-ene-1,7-dioic acid hydratase in catechol pathway
MKVVAFQGETDARLGVVDGDHVVDLQAASSAIPADLGEWLAANDGDLSPLAAIAKLAPAHARRPLGDLPYRLPVGRLGKIICLALNYLDHVREGAQHDNVSKFPTGAPSGVGTARKPPVWMKAGDVCEVEDEGDGVLRNLITEEGP